MIQQRKNIVQTRRDAWVEINLAAIEQNIKELKNFLSEQTKLMAVVKADAYGHGSTMIAPTLAASGVDIFGVASVDEGIELRNTGIETPVLVLGATPEWAFTSAVEQDIQISIFTKEHIKACINSYKRLQKKPSVHIKIDTGMQRIGINHKEAESFIKEVVSTKEINLVGIFSHLACAESNEVTQNQNDLWEKSISNIDKEELIFHVVNTAGVIAHKGLHYDMVRAGIGIYGLMPDLPLNTAKIPNLKQAMGLKGRISYIKEVPINSGISYSYSYKTEQNPTKIATIPVGYADGVPRSLSNRIYGLINGQKVKQIGNITMDQMMFDITEVENVNTGDVITLLGRDKKTCITIDDWAEKLGTINYEITCRLKARLPRVYTRIY